MIESLAEGLAAHRGAPDKEPARRLATLEAAGELAIPFTTGILVGIGDDRRRPAGRAAGHRRLARAPRPRAGGHRPELPAQAGHRHGQGGALPARGPAVGHRGGPPRAPARRPRAGSAEPLRRPRPAARCGHRRLGRRLPGHRRPREPRAGLAGARRAAGRHRGGRPQRWRRASPSTRPSPTTPTVGSTRRCASPCSMRPTPRVWPATRPGARAARSCRPRCSSRLAPPLAAHCRRAPGRRRRGRGPRRRGARARRWASDEIVTLFAARGPEVRMVAEVADDLRRRAVGDAVTFVHNRNINYTNVCTFKCRFCAFSKGPLSLNLRGAPYLLELDEITRRVAEAEAEGATEVCLQGGIHPDFDGDYYLHVLEAVRAASTRIHIHGFTALEVTEGARRSEVPLAEYLTRLKEAGLKTLPGTAAEILDDDVRAVLCPDKITTDEWLEAHRTAHSVGPALEHHDHVRLGGAAAQLGPPHRAHPGAAARDGRLHRVRAAALRAHGHADLPPAQGAAGADLPRDAADALGGAHRLRGRHRQHPGELGEDGRRGRAPGAAGRRQRPRRHAHGREHLAGGRGAATGSAWASRSSRPSWPRWVARWCSARRCTRWREPPRARERPGREGGSPEEQAAEEAAAQRARSTPSSETALCPRPRPGSSRR